MAVSIPYGRYHENFVVNIVGVTRVRCKLYFCPESTVYIPGVSRRITLTEDMLASGKCFWWSFISVHVVCCIELLSGNINTISQHFVTMLGTLAIGLNQVQKPMYPELKFKVTSSSKTHLLDWDKEHGVEILIIEFNPNSVNREQSSICKQQGSDETPKYSPSHLDPGCFTPVLHFRQLESILKSVADEKFSRRLSIGRITNNVTVKASYKYALRRIH